MALITPWSASISGSISGRPLIRVCPQLGAGGAVDIREYPAGGWLNTWLFRWPTISRASNTNLRVKLSSKFQASSTCGRLQRLTSYIPQIAFTTMPFDPIRDIKIPPTWQSNYAVLTVQYYKRQTSFYNHAILYSKLLMRLFRIKLIQRAK